MGVAGTGGPSQRRRRLGLHLFWYVLETGINMGVMPIVFLPACLFMLGAEGYGQFLFALGVVNLVGLAPVQGLTNALLRNMASLTDDRRSLLLRTAFVMASIAVGILLVCGLVACAGSTMFGGGEPSTVKWIALLAVAFAARNILTVGSVDFAIDRRFAQRAVWRSLGSVMALAAIPAWMFFGPVGFPLGYAAGHVVALLMLLAFRRHVLFGKPRYDRSLAAQATTSWLILSLSTFFLTSGRYVHRTILGTVDSFDQVAVFGAAATALDLLVMPIATLGLFGFQLLAAHASMERFSKRFLLRYSAAALAGTVGVYYVAGWLAPWVARLLYAEVAEEAVEPIGIMTLGIAATVLMHAARPFVQKFSSARTLLVIGVVSVVAHLGLGLVLIPTYGLTGAAWAYCSANVITSLVWFSCFVAGPARRSPGSAAGTSIDGFSAG